MRGNKGRTADKKKSAELHRLLREGGYSVYICTAVIEIDGE